MTNEQREKTDMEEQHIIDRYYSGYFEKKNLWQRMVEHRKAQKFARESKKALQRTMSATGEEVEETKEMAQAFFKLLSSKLDMSNRTVPPSPEEVKVAVEQLKDVGRFSVFATVSILPAGGIGLVGLELLARKFGVKNFTFVPSAFRKEFLDKKEASK